jgi:hypothetical protein
MLVALVGLDHLQLLFAAWPPAVWLLIARCLLERADRRRLVALGVAWAALLFPRTTAYFRVSLPPRSCDPRRGSADARQAAPVGVALAVPLAALAAFSLPYLTRAPTRSRARHAAVGAASVVGDARPATRPASRITYTAAYSLPALLSIMACCPCFPAASPTTPARSAARAAVAGVVARARSRR